MQRPKLALASLVALAAIATACSSNKPATTADAVAPTPAPTPAAATPAAPSSPAPAASAAPGSPAPVASAAPAASAAPVASAAPGSPAPVTSAAPGSPAPVGAFAPGACPEKLPEGLDGDRVTCGMVTVPQRYDDPSGKPLQLAVMRIAGDGAEEDPLILAQGGPGGSGLALAGFAKQIEAAAGGRDIILFDQRGARNSVPFLSCTEADKVNAATVSEPLAPAIETAQLAVAYGACAERFRAEGYDPAAFGTDATAQDVRSIVTALGYDEYDFYGVSYGTQIGQALLRDHPEGLRSVILDGVDPLAINAFRGHGWSTTRAIDHLFAACAADAACAAAYPSLEADMFAAGKALDAQPKSVDMGGKPVVVRGTDFLDTAVSILYGGREDIDGAPAAIEKMAKGDLDPIVNDLLSVVLGGATANGLYHAVHCLQDAPLDGYRADEARPELAFLGGTHDGVDTLVPVCQAMGIPDQSAQARRPVTSDIPTLLLSGEFDPVTPVEYATMVAKGLTHSTSVEIPGLGHGVLLREACPQAVAASFLKDPSAAPDTGCVAQTPGFQYQAPAASGAPGASGAPAASGGPAASTVPAASGAPAGSAAPASSAAVPQATPASTPAPTPAPTPLPLASVAPAAVLKVPSPELAPFYQQQLVWTPCEKGKLCTTLTVPRDYGNPGTDPSQTFQIAVIKDPATGDASAYQGPILMNPGGPGASGFDMVARSGHAGDAYHAAYDLVGFDPRGIARSHPVQCLTDQEADAIVFQDDRPQTDAERKAFAASVGMIGAHCAANDPDVYRWMGTDNVARDMDVLRAALGRPDLTYLGLSYGSRLGQTYAQLFPDNVRRMVIDGIVPADTTYAEQLRDQVVSFQATFEEYLRTCATRDTCPLSHDPAEAARQFMGMFATLDQSPAVVPGMGTLHDYMLRDAIIPLLYADPEGWGLIDVAIKPVLAGEYKEALDVYLTGTGRRPDGTYADHAHGLVAFDAVTCADNPNDLTIDQVAALADEADRTSPLLGEGGTWNLLACSGWPVDAGQPRRSFADKPLPVLVVTTRHDPATPYQWGVKVAGEMPGARLLRWEDGWTHIAYGGSPCVTGVVDQFLLTGETPASDMSCVSGKDAKPVPYVPGASAAPATSAAPAASRGPAASTAPASQAP